MVEKSVFEMILNKEIESDINPVAKIHLLIIPKKRINTINNLSDEDTLLVGKMIQVAKDLAKKYEIDESGYRLIFNTNDDGGQTVYHIHLHLIGGEKLKAF